MSSHIWKGEETDSSYVPGSQLEEDNPKGASSSEPREPDTKEVSREETPKPWTVKFGEPTNYAQRKIYKLAEIHRSPELSLALKEWESSEELLSKGIDNKKKVARKTRNEVFFSMAFVSALQVLLLTAAAISSSSQCKNRGFLFAVSAFATFCALVLIWHKGVTSRRLQRAIVDERAVRKALRSSVHQLREEGKSFNFESTSNFIIRRTKFAPRFFGVCFTATTWVAVAICIFGGLCLVAIDHLLCHAS